MSKKILLFSSLFTLLLFSCNKPPLACMELSTNNASVGSVVEFTSCSEHALSYEWFIESSDTLFGRSDQFFTHAFTTAGTYTITLNAYSDFSFVGETSSTTETLVIE